MGIDDEAVVSIFVYASLFGILTLFITVDTQVRGSSMLTNVPELGVNYRYYNYVVGGLTGKLPSHHCPICFSFVMRDGAREWKKQ